MKIGNKLHVRLKVTELGIQIRIYNVGVDNKLAIEKIKGEKDLAFFNQKISVSKNVED